MACAQVFVMGPIVVMVRRPSLHIPVPPEDVQEEAGAIQTIARISSFQSEMAGNAVLQGDPPQWLVQARSYPPSPLRLSSCARPACLLGVVGQGVPATSQRPAAVCTAPHEESGACAPRHCRRRGCRPGDRR